MLTISQLATYAGVTVRAVRHYHQIGLLPEPERDHSGYRSYDAAAVVTLIRIRTLAEAGVPLARVQELLEAGPDEFASAIEQLDKDLRAEVRRLQRNRDQIAKLAAGDSLALPQSAVDFLDALRDLGVDERIIHLERGGWIMIAARAPEMIDEWIATKQEELTRPDVQKLYLMMGEALDWTVDDPRVVDLADLLEGMMEEALAELDGQELPDNFDDPFVDLLDNTMLETSPIAQRLLDILEERGWKGWTRIERVQLEREN
ncbi:MAG: MerR family transcriptional regulator [Marmoricola sp.]